MSTQSKRWKDLERAAATALGGTRILRGSDFSEDAPDVEVTDFPELKVDCKAYKRFSHHTLLKEIQTKYCTKDDVPVLVTKHERQTGAFVTVPLEHYARLLQLLRVYRKISNARK